MLGRSRVAAVAAATALLLAACRGDTPKEVAAPPPKPVVYVAVGASDTVGEGADDPATQAWPTVFARSLPPGSPYTNLGVGGSTVAQALIVQVPKAEAAEPDLVTVWLNVNDALRFVPTHTYERQLGELVRRLRRGGRTKVLVANTPDVSELPIVKACVTPAAPAGSPTCPVPPLFRGPAILGLIASTVAAYNGAIARVVAAEGAVLVDLHAASLARRADGTEPGLASADGFHPSTAGHAAVAAEFWRTYVASGGS